MTEDERALLLLVAKWVSRLEGGLAAGSGASSETAVAIQGLVDRMERRLDLTGAS